MKKDIGHMAANVHVMIGIGHMAANDHLLAGIGHMAANGHMMVDIGHMAENYEEMVGGNEQLCGRFWLRGKKYSHVTAMSGFIYNVLTCVGAAKLEGSSSRDPVIPMDSELYDAYLHTDIG